MAQKRKNKNSKMWLYWLIMFFLFIGAATVCYFVWDTYFRVKDGNEENEEVGLVEKQDNDIDNNDDIDVEIIEDDVVVRDKVKQMEGEDPNELNELTGVVTYMEVVGSNLAIGVNIDQFLTEGTCKLELMLNDEMVFGETVKIVPMVSTSTCDGFNVPVSNIRSGHYDVVVKLASGGKMGTIRGEGGDI